MLLEISNDDYVYNCVQLYTVDFPKYENSAVKKSVIMNIEIDSLTINQLVCLHEVRTSRFSDGNSMARISNPQTVPMDNEIRLLNDPICSKNSWAYVNVIFKAVNDFN
jgi:hypothetical protein